MSKKKPKTIAIDFDGVIHTYISGEYKGYEFEPPIEGAKEAIDYIIDELDYIVIIYTCRSRLDLVKEWLDKYHIRYHYINENPHQYEDVHPAKLYADIYLDDHGLHFYSWEDAVNKIINWNKEGLVSD